MDRPRTALITGTSSGLGQAIAIALARAGYDLALTEMDVTQLKETLTNPDVAKRKVTPVMLDLRSRDSINAAFADSPRAPRRHRSAREQRRPRAGEARPSTSPKPTGTM